MSGVKSFLVKVGGAARRGVFAIGAALGRAFKKEQPQPAEAAKGVSE